MDRKRIQCLSNASLHIPIYLQLFLRYSKLLVENCHIFIPNLCLVATRGVTPSEFRDLLVENRAIIYTPPVFSAPAGGDPVEIS